MHRLKASIKLLSVGLPGLEKSSVTPLKLGLVPAMTTTFFFYSRSQV
jgi:hypothetical protein